VPLLVQRQPLQNSEGENLVLLLDVSGSMNSDDYSPTRLAAGKRVIREFLEIRASLRPHDRVGLVTFSEQTSVVAALAPIADVARRIKSALPRIRPQCTTDLASGLARAGDLLQAEGTTGPRAVLALTDGHHNVDKFDPVATAEVLKGLGIRILVIGVGGAPRDVAEGDMLKIVSNLDDGSPAYRYIGGKDDLLRCFRKLAETRLVKW
jgi:Ca-activated chloride channel family protein